jgi:Ca2+-binding RTX toxin-like protein
MANIIGTKGNDTLVGSSNADTIKGLAGNDTITSNEGDDTLTGGGGKSLSRNNFYILKYRCYAQTMKKANRNE